MKEFLITFIMVLILVVVFFLFGGFLIFENFWLSVFFCSLIVSIVIYYFFKLAIRVEELEKKLDEIVKTRKDA